MKQINYFIGCKTEIEARQRFRILSKKLHPDTPTGDKALFQEMLNQYNEFKQHKQFQKQTIFARFAKLLEHFRGMYTFTKEGDQYTIRFDEDFPAEIIKNFIYEIYYPKHLFEEVNLYDNPPNIVISAYYSSLLSAAFSVYEFIQVTK